MLEGLTPNPQGQKACKTGAMLENIIESMLISSGFQKVQEKKLPIFDLIEKFDGEKWFSRQYRGLIGEYGDAVSVDFLVCDPQKYQSGLAIEVKYQKVAGSVDEKYPYIMLNMKKWNSQGIKSALFFEGNGYRESALNWCQSHANEDITVLEGTTNIMEWIYSNLT